VTTEKMIHMANQIAQFFHAYPQDEALTGVTDHIRQFWEKRMRQQLFAYVDTGGAGLDTLVIAAVGRLRSQAS